jgi:hypothetical protein
MKTPQKELNTENEWEGMRQLATEHLSYTPFSRRRIIDPQSTEE